MRPLRFRRIVTVFLVEIGVALFLVSLRFFCSTVEIYMFIGPIS